MRGLVILSGPSCVGKGPLHNALRKFYPELAEGLHALVLYNSRAPRPGEREGIDYHFRPRGEIEQYRKKPGFVVLDVRGDLQALDLNDVLQALKAHHVFFEGNPYIGRELLTNPALSSVEKLSIFLSPLSRDEIIYFSAPERKVSLPDLVADIMRRKLLRRMQRQKGMPSRRDLDEIERRAISAYSELREAWRFQYVIPNHDGEDSENWDAFYYPVGDARKAIIAFAELLGGRVPPIAETWEERLIA